MTLTVPSRCPDATWRGPRIVSVERGVHPRSCVGVGSGTAGEVSALGLTWTDAWQTVLTATVVYVAVIFLSRLFGQRQFSRFTAYDLPFSFAIGTLIGRVILVRVTLGTAMLAIVTVFSLHALSGWLHHNVPFAHRLMENRPIALVVDGRLHAEGFRRSRTSVLELHEQLRLEGVGSLDDVQMAVIERTGEISVVKRGQRLDSEIFEDVAIPDTGRDGPRR